MRSTPSAREQCLVTDQRVVEEALVWGQELVAFVGANTEVELGFLDDHLRTRLLAEELERDPGGVAELKAQGVARVAHAAVPLEEPLRRRLEHDGHGLARDAHRLPGAQED